MKRGENEIRIAELHRRYDGYPPGDILNLELGSNGSRIIVDTCPHTRDIRIMDDEREIRISLDEEFQVQQLVRNVADSSEEDSRD